MVSKSQPMIHVTLSVPPPINRRYVRRYHLSTEWKRYKRDVGWEMRRLGIKPLEGWVEVIVHWYRKRKAGDSDSIEKCLYDALEGFCYTRDSQIKRHSLEWFDEDPKNARVEVYVAQYETYLGSRRRRMERA